MPRSHGLENIFKGPGVLPGSTPAATSRRRSSSGSDDSGRCRNSDVSASSRSGELASLTMIVSAKLAQNMATIGQRLSVSRRRQRSVRLDSPPSRPPAWGPRGVRPRPAAPCRVSALREAGRDPGRPATVVAIGLHPFVIGTPSGAASFRRVLEALKAQPLVWLTDTDSVMAAAGQKQP